MAAKSTKSTSNGGSGVLNEVDEASIQQYFSSAKSGYEDILTELLTTNSFIKNNINYKDHLGNTALHYAASADHSNIVSLLIANSALSINLQNKVGDTALHKVSSRTCISMVVWIITPQSKAAGRGNEQVTKLLLEAKADPAIKNQDGRTALRIAKGDAVKDLLAEYSTKGVYYFF
jgi:ankyrin repeat protein